MPPIKKATAVRATSAGISRALSATKRDGVARSIKLISVRIVFALGSVQPLPQSNRRGNRSQHKAHQRESTENEQWPAKRHGTRRWRARCRPAHNGERRGADEQGDGHCRGRAGIEVEQNSEPRCCKHERYARGEPVRERLHGERKLERHTAREEKIEGTIFVIRGQEPVESEQAREQGSEPQHGRSDPREQGEIWADGKWYKRYHDQEEEHADERAASEAHGQAQIAQKECR